MKKLIVHTSIFVLLVGVTFLFILALTDGSSDPFYIRFTTPKQTNLILGDSRAAQGLQPDVFNKVLNKDIYNYAFTLAHSPYGPTYLNSIKKKLIKGTSDGIFIVTIDPWGICTDSSTPNDSTLFKERNRCVGNTPVVNMDPNFFYLFHNLAGKYFEPVINFNKKPSNLLHENGWFAVNIKMGEEDIKQRTDRKLENYTNNYIPKFNYSSLRYDYLLKTIHFLQKHGKVYLVRLPISKGILALEKQFMVDFNAKVKSAIELSDGYLDMTLLSNNFVYTDGNHLYTESGAVASEIIANWIARSN
ncbi:MAG: hypothetical protein HRT71_19385 [Flavobacteriales bacterium]|nr:hypothetical protein [Flavobacteriales bacterium]